MAPIQFMPNQAAVDAALRPLADGAIAACDGVLARVWLVGPGDACDTCAMRPECPDQTRCLHLLASAGTLTRLDGPFRRIPLGARLVGRVPLTREAIVARDGLETLGVAEPAWLALHRVRAFGALPLQHGVRCIGVLAVFARGDLDAVVVRHLESLCGLAALALDHVGAYRRLSADRNRVVARNARLVARAREAGIAVDGLIHSSDPPPAPAFDPPLPEANAAATVMVLSPPVAMPAVLAATPVATTTAERSFAEYQREAILRTLAETKWRVSGPRGAARVLGLKPTTLESKMKKLGIRRPPKG
jgi:transcriptional regulator with GAF, ATPase, and Fis domain